MGNIWVNRSMRMSRSEYSCSNPMCPKIFNRNLSESRISKLLFCSISCSTSYYNAVRQNSVLLSKCKRAWYNNYIHSANLRINYCGEKFARLFRQGFTSYSPESVLSIIRSFVLENARIPTRNELEYLNRLARRFFGTWNSAIGVAGLDPNPVMFAKHYLATDGHKCDSMAEKIVDDWLYERKVEHRVHMPYPWHDGMKSDFLVGDTWIEIFGLAGNVARYNELKKNKLDLVQKYNLKLLRLTLEDVYSKKKLDKKFSFVT